MNECECLYRNFELDVLVLLPSYTAKKRGLFYKLVYKR